MSKSFKKIVLGVLSLSLLPSLSVASQRDGSGQSLGGSKMGALVGGAALLSAAGLAYYCFQKYMQTDKTVKPAVHTVSRLQAIVPPVNGKVEYDAPLDVRITLKNDLKNLIFRIQRTYVAHKGQRFSIEEIKAYKGTLQHFLREIEDIKKPRRGYTLPSTTEEYLLDQEIQKLVATLNKYEKLITDTCNKIDEKLQRAEKIKERIAQEAAERKESEVDLYDSELPSSPEIPTFVAAAASAAVQKPAPFKVREHRHKSEALFVEITRFIAEHQEVEDAQKAAVLHQCKQFEAAMEALKSVNGEPTYEERSPKYIKVMKELDAFKKKLSSEDDNDVQKAKDGKPSQSGAWGSTVARALALLTSVSLFN